MSTYTDLHNNIKETINVDYRQRTTNQQVKLLNEQNEYWGTFKGQMEVEGNSVISGAQLNDVIINNAVLCGDIKGGGLDIPIDKITAALQQISDDFQEGDNQLYNKITANSLCIASLDRKINDSTDAYNDVLSETSSLIIKTISQTSAILSNASEQLSSYLSSETSARISADLQIGKSLSEHAGKLNELLDTCIDISALALSVDGNSADRHEDMLRRLAEHNESNEKRFSDEHDIMLDTVKQLRHYELNNDITASYPYKLEDFAVNIIDTAVLGYVLSSPTGTIIANVAYANDSKDTVTVYFYDNLKPFTTEYDAVQLGQKIPDIKNGLDRETGRNDYQIRYDKDACTVSLTHKKGDYLEIKDKRDGITVCKMRQLSSPSEYSCQVLSGVLDINTSDSTLSTFNRFTSNVMSRTLSVIVDKTEKIVLNADLSTLSFFTGVRTVNYMNVTDISTGLSFAKVLEKDVVKDDDAMKQVIVTVDEKQVTLAKDADFIAEYNVDDDDTLYTLKLDGNVLTKFKTYAKYGFYANESDETPRSRGEVRILEENAKDVTSITSDIMYHISEDDTAFGPFKSKDVICAYDKLDAKWHGTLKNVDEYGEDCVNIIVDLKWSSIGLGRVDVSGVVEGMNVTGSYTLDIAPHVWNMDDGAYVEVNRSAALDFELGFDQTMEVHEQQFDMYTARPKSSDDYSDTTYFITHADSSKVEVIFPQRKYSNKLSEFVLRLRVTSDEDTDAKLTFLDEQKLGMTVVVDNQQMLDNTFSIKCNKQLTYRIFEVNDSQFVVEDVFNLALSADMHDSFEAVNMRISAVCVDISGLQEISAVHASALTGLQKISAEHASALTGLQEISAEHQLSIQSALSDISMLSNELSAALKYKGMIAADDSITSFADLLFTHYSLTDRTVAPVDISAYQLYPNEFWIVDTDRNDLCIEGMKVGMNDRIYIKGSGPVMLSAVTSANIDVEDVYDSDTVHEWQLSSCSAIISNALCEASCMLSSDDMYLSSQISSKVSIGTYDASSGHYVMNHRDLSVVMISDDIYYELKGKDELNESVIYVVSSDCLNAHNDKVIKVAKPELSNDAATKGYVDGISAELSDDIVSVRNFAEDNLSGQLSALSVDVSGLIEISADTEERLLSVESHYSKTFKTDVLLKHHIDDTHDNSILSIDRLTLTDETGYILSATEKKYSLALKYGTLVLIEEK